MHPRLKLTASFRDFLDRVEDGTIEIADEDFPFFFYESDRVYDNKNKDMGLFQGFLLVQVFRHIFTGPSSAMNPNMKANKFKAKKFGHMAVTGRTITYACVQVRKFLSFYFAIWIIERHTSLYHL